MVIQHNLQALNSNRMLENCVSGQKKLSEKLSSGYRINRAADDAAGLAISEKMRRQIRGLTQASANAQDGVSLLQSAEGALNEVHDMLQRMNELCVKAANDTLTKSDRAYIQSEIQALNDEIDRNGVTTTFNEIKLLNGFRQTDATLVAPSITGLNNVTVVQATEENDATYTIDALQDNDVLGIKQRDGSTKYYKITDEENDNDGQSEDSPISISKRGAYGEISSALLAANISQTGHVGCSCNPNEDPVTYTVHFRGPLKLTLQVGANVGDEMEISINPINSSSLGLFYVNVDDSTGDQARAAIKDVKNAIKKLSEERSNLGAFQNRLEHTIKNLDNVVENTTKSESAIRDTDMASTMVNHSNNNIIAQAGQAILAQANQSNQGILSLLQ